MFGEPEDESGECNARLFIADNYGDNSATIRCQLPLDHEDLHREEFERRGGKVTITWEVDERQRCDHGCGQWKHAHEDHNEDGTWRCSKHSYDHEFSDCAYCHPGKPGATCEKCGGTYYYETGHKRHCPKEPFTCETCGESGVGPHTWPSCPKEREARARRRRRAGGDPE